MRKFFRIETSYKFEWNDLRCLGMIINVILIICFGLSISWLGLGIAIIGIIRDLTTERWISGLLIHVSSAILNIYFLSLLYNGI